MKTLLPVLFLMSISFFTSCESDSVDPNTTTPPTTLPSAGTDEVSFTKAANADPNDEANQDRITDNVWITRGNDGGQIFNIKSNSDASKSSSPVGTEWAIGTVATKDNLTFAPFRTTIKPKNVVGESLVVHLIDDDIYLNVRFTSWSTNKGGGFAYIRDAVPQ
ncbi:hypothetical protein [Flammeovirga sp. OC4]|uniref:hypothetical protein n=1 Tax=Flammeovirga sp. OC4 TaxID=1382345 RepID=UPI0005C77000|nr:hypothetical protein [Flammeovirga sp. OC4]